MNNYSPIAWAVLACLAVPAVAQDAANSEQALPEIKVKAASTEGSAAAGYQSRTASQVGPLGAKPLLDTPFSINVVSQELIQNLQASKPDDIIKINPVLQLNNPQTRFFSGVSMRGFGMGSNKRVDGQPNSNMISVDMEDKERVEVLTGLSGFLYGPGNVGGTLNYVLKRPTYERYNSVTFGLTSGTNALLHGDFGGPIDAEGRFAYRVNLAAQDGDTSMDYQSISRRFGSAALDWNLSDRLKLQFDASYGDYHMRGTEAYWATSNNVKYPDAPDAGKFWGQPFSTTDTTQQHAAVRMNWKASDVLGVRAGYARRSSTSELVATNNTFTAANGIHMIQSSMWEYPDITNDAAYAFLDASFATGAVQHKLTAGIFGDVDERTNYRGGWTGAGTVTSTGKDLSEPFYQSGYPSASTLIKYTAGKTRTQNIVLGDDIRFSDRWSALLGLNQARIVDKTYFNPNVPTSKETVYDDSRLTPSASLLFKPRTDVTLYASYIEGLEKGGVAQESPIYVISSKTYALTNPNAIMPALISKQIELGAKAEVAQMLLTAALFEIDKGLQYYDITSVPGQATYVQDGRQVHTGVEFTATGRVATGLTLVGGLTLLDPEIRKNASNPALEGKRPTNVADTLAKVYVEYTVPGVTGLTLTGGVYYTGKQAVDNLNTDYVPDFATADIGARYVTRVSQMPLTLRLAITNVTDKSYWLTPNALGPARSVAVSGQLQF